MAKKNIDFLKWLFMSCLAAVIVGVFLPWAESEIIGGTQVAVGLKIVFAGSWISLATCLFGFLGMSQGNFARKLKTES